MQPDIWLPELLGHLAALGKGWLWSGKTFAFDCVPSSSNYLRGPPNIRFYLIIRLTLK